MNKIHTIYIHDLVRCSQLSWVRCADFSEAAAVCLDFHEHQPDLELTVGGDLQGTFKLTWEKITQKIKNSRHDMVATVESGAYCMAMLVIEKLTGFQVIRQSQRRTGFDYWLGNPDNMGFQSLARLEVSGILDGNDAQINQRLREKVQQTKKSDKLNLLAYVVVVEFSQPIIKIKTRQVT